MPLISSTTLLHFFVRLSVLILPLCVFHLCECFVWSHTVVVLVRSYIRSHVTQEIHLSLMVPILFLNVFAALSMIPLTNICRCSSMSVEYTILANKSLVSMHTLSDVVWSFDSMQMTRMWSHNVH